MHACAHTHTHTHTHIKSVRNSRGVQCEIRGGQKTGIGFLFPILTEGENKSICKGKFLSYYQIHFNSTIAENSEENKLA